MNGQELVGKRCRLFFTGGETRVGNVIAFHPTALFALEVEVDGPTARSKPHRLWVRIAQLCAVEVLR